MVPWSWDYFVVLCSDVVFRMMVHLNLKKPLFYILLLISYTVVFCWHRAGSHVLAKSLWNGSPREEETTFILVTQTYIVHNSILLILCFHGCKSVQWDLSSSLCYSLPCFFFVNSTQFSNSRRQQCSIKKFDDEIWFCNVFKAESWTLFSSHCNWPGLERCVSKKGLKFKVKIFFHVTFFTQLSNIQTRATAWIPSQSDFQTVCPSSLQQQGLLEFLI